MNCFRNAILVLVLFLNLNVYGQESVSFGFKSFFSAVIVSNMEISVDWCRSIFKLQIKERMNEDGNGFKVVILQSDKFLLELIENKSALDRKKILTSKPMGTQLQGLFKIGFIVDDMDACISHLSSLKIKIDRVYKDAMGKRNFLITDPDGNLIQFFE